MQTTAVGKPDIKELWRQRPELRHSRFLITRGNRIWVAQLNSPLRIFRYQANDQVFECVHEFLEIVVRADFKMLELKNKDSVIVTRFEEITMIDYYVPSDRYDVIRDLTIKMKDPVQVFPVAELLELTDGTVMATFKSHVPGKTNLTEAIWGPQKVISRLTD